MVASHQQWNTFLSSLKKRDLMYTSCLKHPPSCSTVIQSLRYLLCSNVVIANVVFAEFLFGGGAAGVRPISTMTPQQLWVFERQVLTNQIKLENSVIQVAHSMNKPAVILLDRGALDIAAYLPYHTWKKLLEEVYLLSPKHCCCALKNT